MSQGKSGGHTETPSSLGRTFSAKVRAGRSGYLAMGEAYRRREENYMNDLAMLNFQRIDKSPLIAEISASGPSVGGAKTITAFWNIVSRKAVFKK